jgi:succinyl-diaminopimelate desuccinylase
VTDVIELARALIRLDTCGAGEEHAAQLIAPILSRCGMQVEFDALAPGRASLLARSHGGAGPPLTLSAHLDTVPLGDAPWATDPFGAAIVGDRLCGRGASDTKSGVAALVVALERHMTRTRGSTRVTLLLTAGEETGCHGARRVAAGRALAGGGPLLVSEPTANRLVTGHKGALWLKVTSEGRAAHGSRPDLGTNAITPLARLALDLAEQGLPGSHPAMGRVTANVGTIAGGTRTNLVPDRASMTVDVRTVPGVSSAQLIDAVAGMVRVPLRIEAILDLPAVYSPPDGPLARIVASVLGDVTSDGELAPPVAYFTDASVLTRALDVSETVILGPGDPDQAHATDESCSVARVREAVDIYDAVLGRWGE